MVPDTEMERWRAVGGGGKWDVWSRRRGGGFFKALFPSLVDLVPTLLLESG